MKISNFFWTEQKSLCLLINFTLWCTISMTSSSENKSACRHSKRQKRKGTRKPKCTGPIFDKWKSRKLYFLDVRLPFVRNPEPESAWYFGVRIGSTWSVFVRHLFLCLPQKTVSSSRKETTKNHFSLFNFFVKQKLFFQPSYWFTKQKFKKNSKHKTCLLNKNFLPEKFKLH